MLCYVLVSSAKNVYPTRVSTRVHTHRIVRIKDSKIHEYPKKFMQTQPNTLNKHTTKFSTQTHNRSKVSFTQIHTQKPAKTEYENKFFEFEENKQKCINVQTNLCKTITIHSINLRQTLVPKLSTVQKFQTLKYTH